jgi:hypothetical protein
MPEDEIEELTGKLRICQCGLFAMDVATAVAGLEIAAELRNAALADKMADVAKDALEMTERVCKAEVSHAREKLESYRELARPRTWNLAKKAAADIKDQIYTSLHFC